MPDLVTVLGSPKKNKSAQMERKSVELFFGMIKARHEKFTFAELSSLVEESNSEFFIDQDKVLDRQIYLQKAREAIAQRDLKALEKFLGPAVFVLRQQANRKLFAKHAALKNARNSFILYDKAATLVKWQARRELYGKLLEHYREKFVRPALDSQSMPKKEETELTKQFRAFLAAANGQGDKKFAARLEVFEKNNPEYEKLRSIKKEEKSYIAALWKYEQEIAVQKFLEVWALHVGLLNKNLPDYINAYLQPEAKMLREFIDSLLNRSVSETKESVQKLESAYLPENIQFQNSLSPAIQQEIRQALQNENDPLTEKRDDIEAALAKALLNGVQVPQEQGNVIDDITHLLGTSDQVALYQQLMLRRKELEAQDQTLTKSCQEECAKFEREHTVQSDIFQLDTKSWLMEDDERGQDLPADPKVNLLDISLPGQIENTKVSRITESGIGHIALSQNETRYDLDENTSLLWGVIDRYILEEDLETKKGWLEFVKVLVARGDSVLDELHPELLPLTQIVTEHDLNLLDCILEGMPSASLPMEKIRIVLQQECQRIKDDLQKLGQFTAELSASTRLLAQKIEKLYAIQAGFTDSKYNVLLTNVKMLVEKGLMRISDLNLSWVDDVAWLLLSDTHFLNDIGKDVTRDEFLHKLLHTIEHFKEVKQRFTQANLTDRHKLYLSMLLDNDQLQKPCPFNNQRFGMFAEVLDTYFTQAETFAGFAELKAQIFSIHRVFSGELIHKYLNAIAEFVVKPLNEDSNFAESEILKRDITREIRQWLKETADFYNSNPSAAFAKNDQRHFLQVVHSRIQDRIQQEWENKQNVFCAQKLKALEEYLLKPFSYGRMGWDGVRSQLEFIQSLQDDKMVNYYRNLLQYRLITPLQKLQRNAAEGEDKEKAATEVEQLGFAINDIHTTANQAILISIERHKQLLITPGIEGQNQEDSSTCLERMHNHVMRRLSFMENSEELCGKQNRIKNYLNYLKKAFNFFLNVVTFGKFKDSFFSAEQKRHEKDLLAEGKKEMDLGYLNLKNTAGAA